MKNISFILLFISLKLSLVGASIVQPKLDYIENKGQWHEHVLYKADLKGGIAFLEKDGITYSFVERIDHHHENKSNIWNFLKNIDNPELKKNEIQKGHAFNFKWVNANPGVNISAKQKQSYFNNYFIGDDENKWASSVGNYRQVVYKNLYYQIDALLYSEQNSMKTDYLIKVGGNPTDIKLQYNATDGLTINEKGNLKIKTSINEIYELRPYAYQKIGKIRIEVPCEYELTDNILSFKLPKGYDKNYDLIIDPTLIFSTYSGSPVDNWGSSATNDADGNMFLGGIALGQNYPTTLGAFQRNYGGGDSGSDIGEPSDIVITKFNATGTSRIYSTYLGGNGNELLQSLYCTPQNELVILMTTGSINFPTTTNAFDRTFNGGTSTSIMGIAFPNGTDIALTKLNANGSALVGSTFFGGSENDGQGIYVNYGDETRGDIALTQQGDIIIGTSTASSNLPGTSGRFQSNFGGAARDGFIAKFNSNLSLLNWASYFGGSANENLNGIKLDKNENIFICGGTNSNNLKNITNNFNGYFDGYIAKINSNATQVIASRYLGTTDYDQAFLIDLDDNDNIVLFGQTAGAYPVSSGVYYNNHAGQFIHKLNNQLNSTIFSTVFGSDSAMNITPTALMVDICGHIYAVGWGGGFYINENIGNTFGMPVTPDAFQDSTDGNDFYFINLNRDATQLIYATYFGEYGGIGDHVDGGTSRFDKHGVVYQAVCASCAGTDWFPITPGAYGQHNESNNCNMAGFKFKFDLLSMEITSVEPKTGCINDSVQFSFTATQPAKFYTWEFGDGTSSNLAAPKHKYTQTGTYTIKLKITNEDNCNVVDSTTSTIIISEPSNQTIDTTICQGQSIILGNQTISTTGKYTENFKNIGGCDSIVTLNVTVKSSSFTTIDTTICQGEFVTINNQKYTNSGIYTITIPLASGCDSTITLKLKVNPTNNIRTTTYICKGETYIFDNQILSEPGIYIAKFKNSRGCDSTITMTLNVIQPDSTSIDTVMCLGHPIIFNNQTISAIGSYTAVLKNIFNCDSIVTLNLTAINLPSKITIDTTICQGDIINFHGQIISTSGTFTASITNSKGCDSIITLNVKTNPLNSVTIDTSICQGGSIIFHNQVIKNSGIYTIQFKNTNGCDSLITLNVSINNLPIVSYKDTLICQGDYILFNNQIINSAGIYSDTIHNTAGCDTVIILNVKINPQSAAIQNETICEGESFVFRNQILTKQGIYYDTLLNHLQCDSIVILYLTVTNQPKFISLDTSICQGDFILFNNQIINSTGIYLDTLYNTIGCDTIIALQLKINPSNNLTINKTICEGDSVNFNNQIIYNAGDYTEKLKNNFGCDSIITLHLQTTNQSFLITIDSTICPGESIVFNQQIIQNNGIYKDTIKSPFLCDTIITLNVHINNTPIQILKDTSICQGEIIIFNNQNIIAEGVYKDTISHLIGCDTIITLKVSIKQHHNITTNQTICLGDSIIFNNQVLYNSGTYTANLTNVFGCDSTVTLNLQTNNTSTTITIDTSICQGQTILFDNIIINKAGNYSYTKQNPFGCDTTFNLNVQVNNTPIQVTLDTTICEGDFIIFNQQIIQTAGNYSSTIHNPFGCDSTINLKVNIDNSSVRVIDTSICAGSTITFNNQTISTAGKYSYQIQNNLGCDSIVTLNLNITEPIFSSLKAQICKGDKYTIGNKEFTQNGNYTITLTSSVTKCDSIVQLELTVVDTLKTTLDIKICEGDSVIISNSVFKNSGTYYIPLKSAAQCDSLVILNLNVIAPTFSTLNEKICDGDSLFVGGQYFKRSGIFTIKTKSSELCDSTITLNLIVNEQKQTNIDTTVCNGTIIYIGNHSYTKTGTFKDTLKTTEGCDSVITLNLNVLPTYNLSLNPEICEGDFYKNGDSTFTKTGNYSIVYTAVNGCDSTVNLQLTVHPKKTTNLEHNICEGDSIVVGTQVFKTTGTYTILLKSSKDCDSTVNLNLQVFQHQERTIDTTICEGTIIKIGNEAFNSTGNYTIHLETIHHCDSTIFLNLLVNPAPIINAVVDSSIIQKGKQVQLNVEATEAYNYVWENDNISNPLIQNPTAIITAPVWFVVEAENPKTNCKRVDSVFVDVLILPCNKDYIYIPNAFTPNNDGINDIFRVRSNNLLKGTLIIFDRWGNKVFESDDINIGWDGFYKGNKQQVETYGYYFSGTCDGGATITLKGSVTILE